MITSIPQPNIEFPPPPEIFPITGGMQFNDMAPMLCTVVDNGVAEDDPRVMVKLNEATKMVLDTMVPVGGVAICNVMAKEGILVLPPSFENAFEAHPVSGNSKVFGNSDVRQAWYEIVNNSTYIDPEQSMDNPLIDLGLNANPANPRDVRRVYFYPGLAPADSVVQVTGKKRYLPVTNAEDFPIVQNVHALKLLILSIERDEDGNAPQEAAAYRTEAFQVLQSEVKQHLLDPRNYMFRKSQYMQDVALLEINTMGWIRARIALDVDDALRTGKSNLTWNLMQAERRIMERGVFKDTIVELTAEVVGGFIYAPSNVETILAASLDGTPIPIKSIFHQYIENGPGSFPQSAMLIDETDRKEPGFSSPRRKYRLIASFNDSQCISMVCKLRWLPKQPTDQMVIKNYEALRLMTAAKFLEAKNDFQNSTANQQMAFDIMDKELRSYLSGIKHTPQIQTYGFGLGDVGGYYTR